MYTFVNIFCTIKYHRLWGLKSRNVFPCNFVSKKYQFLWGICSLIAMVFFPLTWKFQNSCSWRQVLHFYCDLGQPERDHWKLSHWYVSLIQFLFMLNAKSSPCVYEVSLVMWHDFHFVWSTLLNKAFLPIFLLWYLFSKLGRTWYKFSYYFSSSFKIMQRIKIEKKKSSSLGVIRS